MEKLKDEADRQRAQQKGDAVQKYIDATFARFEREIDNLHRHSAVTAPLLLACVAITVASLVWDNTAIKVLWIVSAWITINSLFGFRDMLAKVEATDRELDGIFNTLAILGFIEDGWQNRMKKKRKPRKESLLEKVWAKAKTASQWRPYGQPVASPV